MNPCLRRVKGKNIRSEILQVFKEKLVLVVYPPPDISMENRGGIMSTGKDSRFFNQSSLAILRA
jgi:hypothetical protein